MQSIAKDIDFSAIKIGMLFNKEIINVVHQFIKSYGMRCKVVLDPVMVAQSGDPLMDDDMAVYMQQKLFAKSYLLTPNIPEAEYILQRSIVSLEDMSAAASELTWRFKCNVLLKGGHMLGREAVDLLYDYNSEQIAVFINEKINTKNNHGTGCTLSSAIACYLTKGECLQSAVDLAR